MATDSGANPAGEPEEIGGDTGPRKDPAQLPAGDRPPDAEPPTPVDLDTAHDRAS